MSKKLFRFLLSELEIIRVRCTINGCSGVAEMKAENLKSGRHVPFICPVCGNGASSASAGTPNPLDDLGDAIERLKSTGRANNFQIEFELPDPDTPKAP